MVGMLTGVAFAEPRISHGRMTCAGACKKLQGHPLPQ